MDVLHAAVSTAMTFMKWLLENKSTKEGSYTFNPCRPGHALQVWQVKSGSHIGMRLGYLVTGSYGFQIIQPVLHVQLFSHGGGVGCRAVCTDPLDYSTFHLLHI